jgi:HD-like signal output (HDOD) protein
MTSDSKDGTQASGQDKDFFPGKVMTFRMSPDLIVLAQARKLACDPSNRLDEFTLCACQDPVIVIELFKAANSVSIGGGRNSLTSVQAAITRLGTALTLECLDELAERESFKDDSLEKWFETHRSRGKRTAIIARMLAQLLAKSFANECQIGGLLSSTGEMLAVLYLREKYIDLAEHNLPATVNYKLVQEFKFDIEKIGPEYLQRNGVPSELVAAIEGANSKSKTSKYVTLKPLVAAALELVDAFDSGKWDKVAPGLSLPPKSNIRLLQFSDDRQYARLYERASEYLFATKTLEHKQKSVGKQLQQAAQAELLKLKGVLPIGVVRESFADRKRQEDSEDPSTEEEQGKQKETEVDSLKRSETDVIWSVKYSQNEHESDVQSREKESELTESTLSSTNNSISRVQKSGDSVPHSHLVEDPPQEQDAAKPKRYYSPTDQNFSQEATPKTFWKHNIGADLKADIGPNGSQSKLLSNSDRFEEGKSTLNDPSLAPDQPKKDLRSSTTALKEEQLHEQEDIHSPQKQKTQRDQHSDNRPLTQTQIHEILDGDSPLEEDEVIPYPSHPSAKKKSPDQEKQLAPKAQKNIHPSKLIALERAAGTITTMSERMDNAKSSEELLATILVSLVDDGPFEKTALVVVSEDRRNALVVAARGPNIRNGQRLTLDDPLSPLSQCLSKIQSFGREESSTSPFGSKTFAVAPITADHATPVALYADCGNEGSITFEARRIFRTVVQLVNERLKTLPGGIPNELTDQ